MINVKRILRKKNKKKSIRLNAKEKQEQLVVPTYWVSTSILITKKIHLCILLLLLENLM